MKEVNLNPFKKGARVKKPLISLAKRGGVRLPLKHGKSRKFKPLEVMGKPLSEIIIEERR